MRAGDHTTCQPLSEVTLLRDDDPAPFTVHNSRSKSRYVVVCDHASNSVPSALSRLGLSEDQLQLHIAWDIGAKNLANLIGQRLDATVVLSGYSRLVVDCNRYPKDATFIVSESDGHAVPANHNLQPISAYSREREIFAPYHSAIEREIQSRLDAGVVPILVSVHSMTAVMNGVHRKWPISIQSDQDTRLSKPVLRYLQIKCDFPVGDNKPYRLEHDDFTVFEHAVRRRIPHIQVEFRQDCVVDENGVRALGGVFVEALKHAVSTYTDLGYADECSYPVL